MSTIKLDIARGFTLLELAIVLLILGLLIGGLLIPLATQVEQRDRRSVNQQLEEIKQALLGYAVINGHLPCPTREPDPANPDYGMPGTSDCDADGILPWKSLGIPETDPWGSPRRSNTESWRGYWRYRVDSDFADDSPVFELNTEPADGLQIVDADGNWLTPSTAPGPNTPVFIVYSTGPNARADGLNADSAMMDYNDPPDDNNRFQGGTPVGGDEDDPDYFDDITVWMTRSILLSTMLSAKKLP